MVRSKLTALMSLVERLGIEIRETTLESADGGLVVIRGRRLLIIDTRASEAARYDRILREISQLPELNTMFVAPAVRDDLERVNVRHPSGNARG